MEMDDGGAIYTLGNLPGSRISDNVIHDSRGWSGGIYLDAGSAGIAVQRNRLFRVLTPIIVAEGSEASCPLTDNAYEAPPAVPANA